MKFTLLLVKTLFSKTPLGKYGGGMFYSFLRRGMGLYGVRYYTSEGIKGTICYFLFGNISC